MSRFVWVCIVAISIVSLSGPRAEAITQFKKAFQEKYVDPSGNETFKETFRKAGCNTCHVKGEKKNVHNAYGKELSKLIKGDANQRIKDARKEGGSEGRKKEIEKVLEELHKAFEEVSKKKAENGQSYGERIESGQLPAG